MPNEYKFSASARIPTRPLSKKAIDDGLATPEEKEVIVDYENHNIFIYVNGTLYDVTTSVTEVIDEVKEEISNNPDVFTSVKVDIELIDGTTTQVDLNTAILDSYKGINKLSEEQDKIKSALGYVEDELGHVKFEINASDVIEDDEHRFVTDSDKESWSNKINVGSASKITQQEVAIGISGWSTGGSPYTKTISVSGITVDDNPIVDVVLSDDYDTAMAELEAYGLIYKIITNNGSITVYASEAPKQSITIIMKIDRAV